MMEGVILFIFMFHSGSRGWRVGDFVLEFVSGSASSGEVGGAEGVDEGSLKRPRIGVPDGEVWVGLIGVFHVSIICFLQL